jgi:DNA repair exonuclease SbcCD ATPase subunit
MTKRKLRKNADISPPQSPHDGIHTCSRGCKKPGCTRTLRDTIEEQDKQIEALKRDVLEKTAELRNLKEVVHDLRISAEDDLDSIDTAREEIARLQAECKKLKYERIHDINQIGGLQEDYARLKAKVERLTKAGDAMVSEWASGEEKDGRNFLKALVIWSAAKEGKQP